MERASQQCWARPDVLAPVKPPVFAVDGSTELPVGQGFACSMNWLIDLPHLVPPHLRRPGPVVSPARSRAVRGEGEGVTATDQPRRQRHETHLTCPGPHSTIGGASSARRGSRPGERTRSAAKVLGNPRPGIGRPGVGGVGLLCRQPGAADHRRGPGAQQRGSAVARHRVPAHVRRRTAARRADRGPALRATRSADRPDGLHHRVAGQRVRVHRRGV